MPLRSSMSKEEIIKELVNKYNKTGSIGNTKPKDKQHALNIAIAIAYKIKNKKEGYKKIHVSDLVKLLEKVLEEG